MSFHVSTYSLPKRGHEPHENQDAYWPRLTPRVDYASEGFSEFSHSTLLTAVADGATEGMLSEIWARILVVRASCLLPESDLAHFIEGASRAWSRFKHAKTRKGGRLTQLPEWLEEPGLEQGAFSTLAAVRITEDHSWTAAAVGDSCLFHVRDNTLLLCWPLAASRDFAKPPYLLGSEQIQNANFSQHIQTTLGEWVSGDHFLLMTDALSCWFIRKWEEGDKPWRNLLTMGQDGSFEELIRQWRESDGLRNDDVTLVRIQAR